MDNTNEDNKLSSAMKAALSEASIIEYMPLMEQDRELNWTEFYGTLPEIDWEEFMYELDENDQDWIDAESGD